MNRRYDNTVGRQTFHKQANGGNIGDSVEFSHLVEVYQVSRFPVDRGFRFGNQPVDGEYVGFDAVAYRKAADCVFDVVHTRMMMFMLKRMRVVMFIVIVLVFVSVFIANVFTYLFVTVRNNLDADAFDTAFHRGKITDGHTLRYNAVKIVKKANPVIIVKQSCKRGCKHITRRAHIAFYI
jgi:hypothetical protein